MAFGIHEHPIYKPMRNRLVIVAVAAAWAAFEVFYAKDGFWTVVALAMLAYCVWAFLIAFPKGPPAA